MGFSAWKTKCECKLHCSCLVVRHGPPHALLETASSPGNREFTVCLKICRVLFLGHTAKSQYAVRRKRNTRRNKSTRRRLSSPCAPGLAHGEPYSLLCASGQHTAKSWTRWRFNNGSWTACSLPCARVRHTVKVSVCRVLETGTRQTLGFAVWWPYCTRQNKSKQHEPLN